MNVDTGEIRSWASLTEKERTSGRWIALPETDENGQPIRARRESTLEDRKRMLDEIFPPDLLHRNRR